MSAQRHLDDLVHQKVQHKRKCLRSQFLSLALFSDLTSSAHWELRCGFECQDRAFRTEANQECIYLDLQNKLSEVTPNGKKIEQEDESPVIIKFHFIVTSRVCTPKTLLLTESTVCRLEFCHFPRNKE